MDSLMDFNETKRYLKISRATLYRWVTGKKIPAIKMGRQWRFNKERINKWLKDHENIRRK